MADPEITTNAWVRLTLQGIGTFVTRFKGQEGTRVFYGIGREHATDLADIIAMVPATPEEIQAHRTLFFAQAYNADDETLRQLRQTMATTNVWYPAFLERFVAGYDPEPDYDRPQTVRQAEEEEKGMPS